MTDDNEDDMLDCIMAGEELRRIMQEAMNDMNNDDDDDDLWGSSNFSSTENKNETTTKPDTEPTFVLFVPPPPPPPTQTQTPVVKKTIKKKKKDDDDDSDSDSDESSSSAASSSSGDDDSDDGDKKVKKQVPLTLPKTIPTTNGASTNSNNSSRITNIPEAINTTMATKTATTTTTTTSTTTASGTEISSYGNNSNNNEKTEATVFVAAQSTTSTTPTTMTTAGATNSDSDSDSNSTPSRHRRNAFSNETVTATVAVQTTPTTTVPPRNETTVTSIPTPNSAPSTDMKIAKATTTTTTATTTTAKEEIVIKTEEDKTNYSTRKKNKKDDDDDDSSDSDSSSDDDDDEDNDNNNRNNTKANKQSAPLTTKEITLLPEAVSTIPKTITNKKVDEKSSSLSSSSSSEEEEEEEEEDDDDKEEKEKDKENEKVEPTSSPTKLVPKETGKATKTTATTTATSAKAASTTNAVVTKKEESSSEEEEDDDDDDEEEEESTSSEEDDEDDSSEAEEESTSSEEEEEESSSSEEEEEDEMEKGKAKAKIKAKAKANTAKVIAQPKSNAKVDNTTTTKNSLSNKGKGKQEQEQDNTKKERKSTKKNVGTDDDTSDYDKERSVIVGGKSTKIIPIHDVSSVGSPLGTMEDDGLLGLSSSSLLSVDDENDKNNDIQQEQQQQQQQQQQQPQHVLENKYFLPSRSNNNNNDYTIPNIRNNNYNDPSINNKQQQSRFGQMEPKMEPPIMTDDDTFNQNFPMSALNNDYYMSYNHHNMNSQNEYNNSNTNRVDPGGTSYCSKRVNSINERMYGYNDEQQTRVGHNLERVLFALEETAAASKKNIDPPESNTNNIPKLSYSLYNNNTNNSVVRTDPPIVQKDIITHDPLIERLTNATRKENNIQRIVDNRDPPIHDTAASSIGRRKRTSSHLSDDVRSDHRFYNKNDESTTDPPSGSSRRRKFGDNIGDNDGRFVIDDNINYTKNKNSGMLLSSYTGGSHRGDNNRSSSFRHDRRSTRKRSTASQNEESVTSLDYHPSVSSNGMDDSTTFLEVHENNNSERSNETDIVHNNNNRVQNKWFDSRNNNKNNNNNTSASEMGSFASSEEFASIEPIGNVVRGTSALDPPSVHKKVAFDDQSELTVGYYDIEDQQQISVTTPFENPQDSHDKETDWNNDGKGQSIQPVLENTIVSGMDDTAVSGTDETGAVVGNIARYNKYNDDDTTYDGDIESTKHRTQAEPKLPLVHGRCDVLFLLHLVLIFIVIMIAVMVTKRNDSKDIVVSEPSPIISPTVSPTSTNVIIGIPWEASQSFEGAFGSGFGSLVAYDNGRLVVGESDGSADDRTLKSYFLESNGTWVEERTSIPVEQPDSRFGSSISIVNTRMMIGAPLAYADNTNIPSGNAYFYIYSVLSSTWGQLDAKLRVGADSVSIQDGEEFGSAVSIGGEFRAAIGAPKHTLLDFVSGRAEMEVGRIYTYEIQRNESEILQWISTDEFPFVGTASGDRFGSAVAFSNDGSMLIGGAPGTTNSTGYVQMYSWRTPNWFDMGRIRGVEINEYFGSSVVMLSDSGNTFAVGAPGFRNKSGRVVVFQKNDTNGPFIQIGTDIVGEQGDEIGSKNSLSGFMLEGDSNLSLLFVVVGTKLGLVKRFDYNAETNVWEQLHTDIVTDSSSVVAVDVTSNGIEDQLFVGNQDTNTLSIYTSNRE